MDLTAAVDECLRDGMAGGRYRGLVVGVSTSDDRVVRAAGEVQPDGLFELGSVTKVFTGLALALAAVRGEVALDEPVADLLPGVRVPVGWGRRPILLWHLATHLSGLPRLPVGLLWKLRGDLRDPYAGVDADWLYASLAQTRLRPWRPPGRRYRYSNLGMGLLGHALARRVTGGSDSRGEDYARMVRERICVPLGLADTVHGDGDGRIVQGHSGAGTPVPPWDLAAVAGAGGLRATADDVLTFLDAQLGRAEVTGDLAAAMALTHRVRYAGRKIRVGLAWHVDPGPGAPRTYWHDGGTGGGASVAVFAPAHGRAVVILANQARSVWPLVVRLRRALDAD